MSTLQLSEIFSLCAFAQSSLIECSSGEKKSCLSKKTLSILSGRDRRFGIQKFPTSSEPETKYALQPIRMTDVQDAGFQPLASHKLLKFSESAAATTVFLLRSKPLDAVMKSLVQYSKVLSRATTLPSMSAYTSHMEGPVLWISARQASGHFSESSLCAETSALLHRRSPARLEGHDEAVPCGNVVGKDGLCNTYLLSALLLHREKQAPLLSVEAAAA